MIIRPKITIIKNSYFLFLNMAYFYDTLLGEYIKNPWTKWLSLDKLASRDFNYRMISYDYITNKWKINFKDLDLKYASVYSGEDVYMTYQLYNKQKQDQISDNKVLQEIELPLIEVLKNVEIDGVKINRDRLKEIWIHLTNEINRLEKEIYKEAEEEFNINSPKQVWELLFWKLWIKASKKTKTWFSVSAEVLNDLSFQYKIADLIVQYRHYSKLQWTYIEWLQKLLDDNDFLHTSYNQAVTTTWRLSSTNPNLQNIPASDWIAWDIRWAFVSRFENWKILAIDYSQIEMRILAILSEDKNLLETFKNNEDIHKKTWEFIFPWKQIWQYERKVAKAVNFWVIYWISAFWLSKMIWISPKDAKIYIDKFFESYHKVKEFQDKIIKDCEQNNYVQTFFKRKRYINWINDQNKIIKQSAEREAINMPIQWTNADIIKIAMIKIHNFLKENNLKSKMIMQVHDELVFDVFPWEEDILSQNAKNIMENILKNTPIILRADIWIGKNWREAK